MKNLIILPNGTEIFSGDARNNAIISCAYTQCVNDGTELSIGSACCNELEVKLFAKNLLINANDEIQYYRVSDNGNRTKIGVLRCEKPTITGTGTYKFVAYDNVSKLDKDLTEWLDALDGWPYTVAAFAEKVCAACGLSLAAPPAVSASYKIRKFSGSGVTGRMLMQWLGQITCRFIRANADGEIEFAWYTDKGAEITTSGEFAYFGGGLSYEDYQVVEIQKVQIQATDEDNGTVYPDGSEEELNTYKITGNCLLTAETGDELKPVAQAIYEQLQDVTYTPCKVSVQATTEINAGDIVHITDRNGVTITTYVMSKTNKGQKDTLECTGSYKRGSSTATNNLTLKALSGKVLNISKTVDGLRISNKDTAGKVADLELSVDGITSRVENAEGDISKIEQTAGEVHVVAQKKKILGAAYSFDVVDGELVLTYTGDQPPYSINDKGELVLEYEGDTPPDTWIDEDGVLHSADESAMLTELIGTLSSVIDGDGTWETKFEQNGEVVSSIRFDLATRRFVFDGDIIVGKDLEDNITKITEDTLATTNVVAQNLQVNAANVTGTLTGNVLSGVTGEFSGKVTATYINAVSGGNIAGWTIDDNSMRIGSLGASGSMWLCNTGTSTSANIGTGSGNNWCIAVGNQFGVKKNGVLYASNVDLSGKITAESGRIGGWNIGNITAKDGSTTLYSGQALYSDSYTEGSDGYPTLVGATLRIALTPKYLILYGTKDGDNIAISRQWSRILAKTA